MKVNQTRSIDRVSHNGTGMDVVVAKTVCNMIIDGGVGKLREVAMRGLVVAMHEVVIGRGEVGFIEIGSGVGVIFRVIRKCPKLSFSPNSPHHFQYLPFLYISSHCHFLLLHVYIHAIHTMQLGDCLSYPFFASFAVHVNPKLNHLYIHSFIFSKKYKYGCMN